MEGWVMEPNIGRGDLVAHMIDPCPTKCETGLEVWDKLTFARLISGIPPVAKPAKTVSAWFPFPYPKNSRTYKRTCAGMRPEERRWHRPVRFYRGPVRGRGNEVPYGRVDETSKAEYEVDQNRSLVLRTVYAVHCTCMGGSTHLAVVRDRLLIIWYIATIGRSMRVLTPVPRSKERQR